MTTYFNYPSEELQKELKEIANALAAPGKGKF
jgi:fructose-bisphosphate aldolase class I